MRFNFQKFSQCHNYWVKFYYMKELIITLITASTGNILDFYITINGSFFKKRIKHLLRDKYHTLSFSHHFTTKIGLEFRQKRTGSIQMRMQVFFKPCQGFPN